MKPCWVYRVLLLASLAIPMSTKHQHAIQHTKPRHQAQDFRQPRQFSVLQHDDASFNHTQPHIKPPTKPQRGNKQSKPQQAQQHVNRAEHQHHHAYQRNHTERAAQDSGLQARRHAAEQLLRHSDNTTLDTSSSERDSKFFEAWGQSYDGVDSSAADEVSIQARSPLNSGVVSALIKVAASVVRELDTGSGKEDEGDGFWDADHSIWLQKYDEFGD